MTALIRPFSVPGSHQSFSAARAEGRSVFDREGRRYLSAASGLWNVALGWGDRRLVKAIEEQVRRMAYASLFDEEHSPAGELATRLVGLTGGAMSFAYLSTTGSSSVEAAIRLARLHHRVRGEHRRTKVVSYDLGYHGCSWGTYSASGIVRTETQEWEPPLGDFLLTASPVDEEEALRSTATLLADHAGEIACMVVEPVLGSAGIVVPSRAYGRRLTELCRRSGVPLIADEVASGGGRCGAMFASDEVGLEPDVICLSKGLGAGYLPIGATLASRRIIAPISSANVPLPFGSTQDGNPVACAAALATLDIIEGDDLLIRAASVGDVVRGRLSDMHLPRIAVVRGIGLMIGIGLVQADGAAYSEADAAAVRLACREEGLLVQHFAGGISLFPALTITDDEVDEMLDVLQDVIARLS